jgi:hypothetical protein
LKKSIKKRTGDDILKETYIAGDRIIVHRNIKLQKRKKKLVENTKRSKGFKTNQHFALMAIVREVKTNELLIEMEEDHKELELKKGEIYLIVKYLCKNTESK